MSAIESAGEKALIRKLLLKTSTIAVVGASSNMWRDSHAVMAFLQARGYRTLPVNPNEVGHSIHGEAAVARLADLEGPVELVDVFRNSAAAAAAVDEAIAEKERLGIRGVWLQLGVHNDSAAARARAAGLAVIQNRCIKIDYVALFGSAPRQTLSDER